MIRITKRLRGLGLGREPSESEHIFKCRPSQVGVIYEEYQPMRVS